MPQNCPKLLSTKQKFASCQAKPGELLSAKQRKPQFFSQKIALDTQLFDLSNFSVISDIFLVKNHFSHMPLLSSCTVLYTSYKACAMECVNQAISLILSHHNFLICFEVLHKKTTDFIVHPCNTATETKTSLGWRKCTMYQLHLLLWHTRINGHAAE